MEGEKEGERERETSMSERHINWFPTAYTLTGAGDQTCTQVCALVGGSNPPPVSAQGDASTTGQTHPGLTVCNSKCSLSCPLPLTQIPQCWEWAEYARLFHVLLTLAENGEVPDSF